MEPLQSKQHTRPINPILLVGLVAFILTCGVIACGRALRAYTLRDSLDPAIPVLDLNVAFYDAAGRPLAKQGETALTSVAPSLPEQKNEESLPPCSTIVGGDVGVSRPSQPRVRWGAPTPVPCPMEAKWNVFRHPIAASFFITDGDSLLSWYDENRSFAQVRDTPLWSGLTEAFTTALKVRGADLSLPTLPLPDWSGQFLRPLLKEIVRANATIHYDLVHGAGGLVLSFDKEKTSIVAQALPLLVRHLGAAAYEVTLPETGAYSGKRTIGTVVQLRLQGRKVFVYEFDKRVFFGTSLEGLLNVLSDGSTLLPPPGNVPVHTSVLAVVRSEAFFDKLLPIVIGKSDAPIIFALALSKERGEIIETRIPKGRYLDLLADKPHPGILASVPRDVLGAVVTSAKVPLDLPVSQWSFNSAKTLQEGGLALVWDIHGESRSFHYGIVVAATGESLENREKLFSLLSPNAVATTCAGDAIWLGASSDLLLSRMREACDKRSLSLLDLKSEAWKKSSSDAGKNAGSPVDVWDIEHHPLSFIINPKVFVKELYRMGGGASYPTEPERQLEAEVQKRLLHETDRMVEGLPILGFSGGVSNQMIGAVDEVRENSERNGELTNGPTTGDLPFLTLHGFFI